MEILNGVPVRMRPLRNFLLDITLVPVLLLVIICVLTLLFLVGVLIYALSGLATLWEWVRSCMGSPNQFPLKTCQSIMELVKKVRKF